MNSSLDNSSSDHEVPVFDPARLHILLQLEDDDEHSTIKTIVEQFLVDVAVQMNCIDQAIAGNDFPQAARAAHTIKGNAATFGLYRVEMIAKELEAAIKVAGNDNPASLCKSLREAFAIGKHALTVCLAGQ